MKGFTVAFLCLFACTAFAQQSIVKTITIRGLNVINDAAIRAAMSTKETNVLQQALLRSDESRILDLGYFKDVRITTAQLSETEVEVIVDVVENPIIREIRFKGNTVFTAEELTAIVTPIQELGKIYNNRYQARILTAIENIYADKGYLIGIDQLSPDPESEGTLVISILEPRINEIRLIGLKRTNENVIRRIMKVKPGDPYNEKLLREDLEEIWATRWFDDIIPRRLDTAQPAVYNVEIEFVEARTGQINGGVALDPQSRLVGFVSYSDSNFRGLGQSAGINLSQATAGGGLSAEVVWANRFMDTKDTAMSVRLYSRVIYNFSGNGFGGGGSGGPLEGSKFDERRTGGSVNFARPFGKVNRGRVGLRFENVRSINFDSSGSDNFVQQDGDILVLQLGADRDTRHPTIDPFQGELVSLQFEPSYSNINKIGGSVSTFDEILGPNYFFRTTLDFRKYWSKAMPPDTPVTKARPVVLARASYTALTGDVPFFEQTFIGGLGSLRGYDNQRFWGKQSFISTVEYRHPIRDNFSLVAFADAGSAWGGYPGIQSFSQTSSPDFHLGYGLGISFRTPVGPIRIDFAFNEKGGSRTHFAFGSSF